MKFQLFICITILIIACKNDNINKTSIINGFPIDKIITGEPVIFDKIPSCPDYVTIIDTFLIIKNFQFCDKHIFYIYNKNNYKYITSFGVKGKGPDEFLKPKPTGQFEVKDGSIGMWIYDFYKLKYQLINIHQTIQQNKTIIEKEFSAPKAVDVGLEVFVLENNDLIGTSMSPRGRLFYFDAENKTTRWIDYFPEVKYPPIKEKQMHNLYASTTKISPDRKYVVSALRLFKRIDVFNNKLKHLFSLVFRDSPKEPDFFVNKKDPIPGKLVHYYGDLYLSKKYIYALNYRITQEQLSKEIDPGYSEVHVFSYNGKPVAVYKLNHFIGAFAVDEENGYILGVCMPKDDSSSALIRFKIK